MIGGLCVCGEVEYWCGGGGGVVIEVGVFG